MTIIEARNKTELGCGYHRKGRKWYIKKAGFPENDKKIHSDPYGNFSTLYFSDIFADDWEVGTGIGEKDYEDAQSLKEEQ